MEWRELLEYIPLLDQFGYQLVSIGNLGGLDILAALTCDVEMITGLQVHTIKVTLACPEDDSKLFCILYSK